VLDWHEKEEAKNAKPMFMFESRLKQKLFENVVDENQVESSFIEKQHKKEKEDREKYHKDKELAVIKAEEERKRQALITPSSLRLWNNPKIRHGTQSQGSFKEMNLVLADFQKNEMRFLNKFVKECDDVSLKINRFVAAVQPPTEKIMYPSP